MADIFISYAREDRDTAERIAGALQGGGRSVWWDRQINAGESFDHRIERELESAGCVLVLWSGASVMSEWVKNEAAAAMERNAMIPVLIEQVKVPIEFRRRQAADLSRWDGATDDAEFAALRRGIDAKLSAPGSPPAPALAAPRTSPPLGGRRTRVLAAAGLVAAVLAVAADRWRPQNDADPAVDESQPAQPQVETYAMVCTGGGPFGIRRESDDLRIRFVPATDKADASMPPGQCSWTDRRLNPNEPSELCEERKSGAKLAAALE